MSEIKVYYYGYRLEDFGKDLVTDMRFLDLESSITQYVKKSDHDQAIKQKDAEIEAKDDKIKLLEAKLEKCKKQRNHIFHILSPLKEESIIVYIEEYDAELNSITIESIKGDK